MQFQHIIQAQPQHIENQIGQLATSMSRMEARASGKLLSQLEINPKENVSVMTHRSGKQLEQTPHSPPKETQVEGMVSSVKRTLSLL